MTTESQLAAFHAFAEAVKNYPSTMDDPGNAESREIAEADHAIAQVVAAHYRLKVACAPSRVTE